MRVRGPDPAVASAIERALHDRGASARVEAVAGDAASADIAVLEPEGERWLEPVPLPPEPLGASRALVSFLESWGFLVRRGVP